MTEQNPRDGTGITALADEGQMVTNQRSISVSETMLGWVNEWGSHKHKKSETIRELQIRDIKFNRFQETYGESIYFAAEGQWFSIDFNRGEKQIGASINYLPPVYQQERWPENGKGN